MSIVDYYQVDGLGINNRDENDLIMLIQDNLSWNDEKIHIQHLQKKIAAYVNYIKSKQYENAYPNMEINKFTIDIHMTEYPTDAGIKFLDIVNKDVIKDNIQVIVAVENNSNSGG